MLVNMKDMLNSAMKEHYAVGLFNIFNLEWTKVILETHQEKNAPVILGVSEGGAKYMGGFNTIVAMVRGLITDLNITVPVVLMLDHGSYISCQKALAAGFSSLMFDGSKYSLDENIKLTADIVKSAHKQGVTVEGEVGSIGGDVDGIINYGKVATPEECLYLAETGIDALAAGFGNIHGKYPEDWEGLNFGALSSIKSTIGDMPIVLHGGSGIPNEQIKEAILLGVAKVNVSTELQMSFAKSTRQYFEEQRDLSGKGYDIRKLMKTGVDNIKLNIINKLQLFETIDKALVER